jgi:hypothetical protein
MLSSFSSRLREDGRATSLPPSPPLSFLSFYHFVAVWWVVFLALFTSLEVLSIVLYDLFCPELQPLCLDLFTVPVSSNTMFSLSFPATMAVFVQVFRSNFLNLDLHPSDGLCLPHAPPQFSPAFQLHNAPDCVSFNPPRVEAWLSRAGRLFSCIGAGSLFLMRPARRRRCFYFIFLLFICSVFLCYLVYGLVLVPLYSTVSILDYKQCFYLSASFR